ncbi:MAG: sigma-70 family RNA polymerase sigma factor [Acidobacteria bacterium]|nr:sigma-70 family RNA polymerase sigma factor [Acidobacteriota bacterium]
MPQTAATTDRFDPTVWVDEHGDYLFSFALARVRNETVAEDLVQETLLAAIQARKTFDQRSSERTWLSGILKHKVIDHFRRSYRDVELSDEEDTDLSAYDHLYQSEGRGKGHWTAMSKPDTWEQTPEAVMEHAEFRGILSTCLGNLPDRVANAFALREFDGYDSDEICALLEITPNNLWVMLHRARLHLRRCLDHNWFGKVRQ